jgi:hypothetical protein
MGRGRGAALGLLIATACACVLASCNAIFGLDERPLLSDASATDSATSDSWTPADGANDAPRNCPADPNGFHDIQVTDCWSTFDLASLGTAVAGFEGAAFDGHYLYLVPSPGSIVVRYDTTADFSTAGAWKTFDVAQALNITPSFAGAVFDGSSVTFVPAKSTTFVHYQTTSSFTDPTAWSALDPTVGAGLSMTAGYAGGTFDGRYLYFIPNDSTWGQRHDSRGIFSDVTTWAAHHIVPLQTDAGPGFFGAAFDGRYVYMSPGTLLPNSLGYLLRVDSQGDFTANTSFDTFDMTTVNKNAAAFRGAAFDGQYVYFAPTGLGGAHAVVTRFDSHGMLANQGAWSAFDLTMLPSAVGHFFGAAFDGRFVYFVPWGTTNAGPNGLLVRYDSTSPFSAASSWSAFDTNAIQAAAFQGSAFDGRYVYFVPQSGTVVARFEARATSMMPVLPGFSGSFF